MKDLIITSIQTQLYWEDIDRNLDHFNTKLNNLKEATDIIVLPEMFTTGFTMNPVKFAEEQRGKGLLWMIEKAQEKNAAVVGSISVKERGSFINRLYWVKPDGNFEFYDKRHLFRMGNEHQHYNTGHKKLIIEYKGWKICPLICYDLRFPIWARNIKDNPYDVLIYVANWPEVRSYPWKHLLIARAIENQAYVVGVNCVGEDGNGLVHSGDSMVCNPRGEIISTPNSHRESSESVSLSLLYLQEFRKTFPVLMDGDEFEIK